jgi:anti-sigma regulatory factor (Ser/Thr protein kinase)
VANDRYVPLQRLADFLPAEADPLEGVPAAVELSDPTPSAARAAVKALVADRVAAERMDALVLGVSEAVTNAALHGVPPVSVRAWLGDGRVVVRVHDRGSGPTDPLAGLVPTPGAGSLSGRGLWIAHQLDLDVALVAAEDGFSVRFRCEVEGACATA